MTPIATDSELIRACRAGQLGAFAQLVERYQNLVCAVAFSATGDRGLSEDVGQETFVAAWKALPSLEDPTKLRGWLCQTARNVSKMALRKRRREVAVEDDVLERPSEAASALDGVVDREQAAIVQRALAEIPETYREPLVLFYREDQSIKQVADGLGLTEDAVKQRLSRGRQSLKQEIVDVLEHSLTSTRPRKAFAVGVLAIIGAQVGTSTAMAANGASAAKATAGGGWTAWKVGLAALVAGAVLIGTIAIAISLRSRGTEPTGSSIAGATPTTRLAVQHSGPRGAPPRGAPPLSAATLEEVDRALDPRRPQVVVEVLDVLGGPIGGAEVFEDDRLVGQTDERGLLALARVPSTVSQIQSFRVRASGYADEKVTYSGFGRVTLQLVPESTISGTVVDVRSHAPLAGVRVFARDLAPVTTDAGGAFTFASLRPGRYELHAAGPGWSTTRGTTIDLGLHYNEAGVQLVVDRGYAIEGRVVADAVPQGLSIVGGPYDVPVGSDGRFRIEGVAPGSYQLALERRPNTNIDVDVVDRDVQGIELRLATGHEIEIVTTHAGGAPAAGVRVLGQLHRESGNAVDVALSSVSCTTDDRGHCRLDGLAAGTLRDLRPQLPGVAAREVAVPSTAPVVFEVPPLGGIAGVVVDASERPLPWRLLTVTREGDERSVGPVVSDATGRFLFGGLPAGTYAVDVFAHDHRSFMAYLTERTKQPIGHATITIAGGELSSDARIATTFTAAKLAGTVTTADGQPVPGALVSFAIESPRVQHRQPTVGLTTAVTDERGQFVFPSVDASRTYDVWAQGPGGEQARRRQVTPADASLTLTIKAPAELRVTVPDAGRARALTEVVIEHPEGDRERSTLHPTLGVPYADANMAKFVGLRAGTWQIKVTQGAKTTTASVVVPEAGVASVTVELPSS